MTVDSSAGAFEVKIDGTALKRASLLPGGEVAVYAPAELFTEGMHSLTLTRVDGGADPVKLTLVEISGSWRVGWINGGHEELGGDITTVAGTKTYYVTDLSSNRWKTVRSSVSAKRILALYTDLNAYDVAHREFTVRSRPIGYPAQSYDLVMSLNGEEIFRRPCLSNDGVLRPSPIVISIPPGKLVAGENEFTWKTEINENYPAPTGTWLQLDYFSLEVGMPPTGLNIIFR